LPRNDPLCQSQRYFHRCLEIVKDMAGTAWCTGSGWLIRCQALEDVKGFPTYSLTEDLGISMELMAAGWKTAYIPEALQYGLLPDTYYAHIKQWVRWVSCDLLLVP